MGRPRVGTAWVFIWRRVRNRLGYFWVRFGFRRSATLGSVFASTTSPRSGDQDLFLAPLLMPPVGFEHEEFVQHHLDRGPVHGLGSTSEPADLVHVCWQWLFCRVIDVEQPIIGRILVPGEMRRGRAVIGDVAVVVVHAARPKMLGESRCNYTSSRFARSGRAAKSLVMHTPRSSCSCRTPDCRSTSSGTGAGSTGRPGGFPFWALAVLPARRAP